MKKEIKHRLKNNMLVVTFSNQKYFQILKWNKKEKNKLRASKSKRTSICRVATCEWEARLGWMESGSINKSLNSSWQNKTKQTKRVTGFDSVVSVWFSNYNERNYKNYPLVEFCQNSGYQFYFLIFKKEELQWKLNCFSFLSKGWTWRLSITVRIVNG